MGSPPASSLLLCAEKQQKQEKSFGTRECIDPARCTRLVQQLSLVRDFSLWDWSLELLDYLQASPIRMKAQKSILSSDYHRAVLASLMGE